MFAPVEQIQLKLFSEAKFVYVTAFWEWKLKLCGWKRGSFHSFMHDTHITTQVDNLIADEAVH